MSTKDFESIQFDKSGKMVAVVHRNKQFRSEKFRLGDVLNFRLNSGEYVRAVMVRNSSNGAFFCFWDCLKTLYPVNGTDSNLGGFSKSILRKFLNQEIYSLFPDFIKDYMVPLGNGDYLRIPTEKEVFGENKFGHPENENILMWSPFTDKRKVFVFKGSNSGLLTSYWLRNEAKNGDQFFCCVTQDGKVSFDRADTLKGVRPVFKLKIGRVANEAEEVEA